MINAMDKHEKFLLDDLLPALVGHARRVGCDPDEAALASFMALGTLLIERGFSADSLMVAIKASALTTHDAPEGLQ